MDGYPMEPTQLDADAYRMLLPFVTSAGLLALLEDETDPLNLMQKRFERSEACRLLLSAAVTIRNSVENRRDRSAELHLAAPVGTRVAGDSDGVGACELKERCFPVDCVQSGEATCRIPCL